VTFPEWCRVIAGKLRLQALYISIVIDERPDLLLENAEESGILNVRSLQVARSSNLSSLSLLSALLSEEGSVWKK
jgi:hypothetical protein